MEVMDICIFTLCFLVMFFSIFEAGNFGSDGRKVSVVCTTKGMGGGSVVVASEGVTMYVGSISGSPSTCMHSLWASSDKPGTVVSSNGEGRSKHTPDENMSSSSRLLISCVLACIVDKGERVAARVFRVDEIL